MENKKIYACFLLILVISTMVNARPQVMDMDDRDADPGWVRRQLLKVGEAASRVGSGVGGYAVRLTNAVDRICGIIKKIIPIVGAVCSVGQFQFCALDNATGEFAGEVGPSMQGRSTGSIPYNGQQTDLEALDK